MRGPDLSQEQSSPHRAVADHVSGTGKSRPAVPFQLNNPSPAALLQKNPADNAPVQMYNETLIAIAEYLGVAPVIETVAAAIGISAGALTMGLGALSAIALLWSVPKIIQYLTRKPVSAPKGKSKRRRKRKKKGKNKQPVITTPTASVIEEEEESEQSDSEEEIEDTDNVTDITAADDTEADDMEEASDLEEKEKEEKEKANDSNDTDDWTPARKPKVRKTRAEKAEEEEDRAQHALAVAKAHLLKMSKKRSGSTVSVFLTANGVIISDGESGWSRKEYKPDYINFYLSTMIVAKKGQEAGYGGIVCAEPQAILKAGGSLSSAKYSLAYDTKSKKFKCACGSCTKYLQDKNIFDLATLL